MKPRAWCFLVWRELAAHPGRALLLLFCVALSSMLAGLALHAIFYLRFEVRPHLLKLFPEERLVVRPGDLDIAFFKFETGKLSEPVRAEIEAMPDVAHVYPQMSADFPVMAEMRIGRMDLDYSSDVIIFGVPGELIASDLPKGTEFTYTSDRRGPVPVAVSAYFLDMYNMGLAESADLPKLSASAAIGREFDLTLGASSLGLAGTETPRTIRAKIVGLTQNPMLVGLVVPLEAMKEWNATYKPNEPIVYSVLHVDMRDPEAVSHVRETLVKKGFRVSTASDNLERLRKVVGGIEGFLFGAMILILALASVGILTTVAMSARERRPAWGLARATGLTPGAMLGLAVSEAIIVAFFAAFVAVAGYDVALIAVRHFAGEAISTSQILPGNPLAYQGAVALAINGLALAMVVIPTIVFAWPNVRNEPVELLARRSL